MKILLFILLYFDHFDMETTYSKRTKYVLAEIINENITLHFVVSDHLGITFFSL